MKLKSISALQFYVTDLNKTADFYETLGFHLEKREPDFVMVRINWFWVEFYEGEAAPGDGQFVYVSVESADEMYDYLKSKNIETEGEVKDSLTVKGRRELLVKDPDGYQLVFFHKK
jgi:catechol 2,3-dioxygenase-like lactoylglutathione lyase family enzyme